MDYFNGFLTVSTEFSTKMGKTQGITICIIPNKNYYFRVIVKI